MKLKIVRLHPADGYWLTIADANKGKLNILDYSHAAAGESTKFDDRGMVGFKMVHIEPCTVVAATGPDVMLVREQIARGDRPAGIAPASKVAWQVQGTSILYCGQFQARLNQFERGTVVLPEAACIARAFGELHPTAMLRNTLHVHVWRDAITLFFYSGGALLRAQREEVEGTEELAFEEAMKTLLQEGGKWLNRLESVFISGFVEGLNFEEARWLNEPLRPYATDYSIQWVDGSGVISAKEGIGYYRKDDGASPYGMPFVWYGAARIVESGIGAALVGDEFRGEPGSTSAERMVAIQSRVRNFGGYLLSGGIAALLGLIVGAAWFGITYSRLSREKASLTNQIAQQDEKEKELTRLRKEATDLIAATKAITQISTQIREAEPLQKTPFQVLDLIRQKWVKGMVFKRVKMSGNSITIEGQITVGSVYGTSRPGQPPLKGKEKEPPADQVPLPPFDPGAIVAQFAQNLRDSGGSLQNIVPNTTTDSESRASFSVTCTYTGKVLVKPFESEPLSKIFADKLKTTTLTPYGK
jgi:hypothetical protein